MSAVFKSLFKHREMQLLAAIVALALLIAIRFPRFIAPENLVEVYDDSAILVILALGQTVVILTKCVDLSTAATLALCGMAAAMLNATHPGLPIGIVMLLAVVMGGCLGAVNGLLVWKVNLPPIVVTLGTMTIYRGLVFVLSEGKWVNAYQMSDSFKALPRAMFAGVSILSWISIAVIAVMLMVTKRTKLGRNFFAVGGNAGAAVYAGIDPGRTRLYAYMISGALSGLAGYLWIARYAVAYVDIALGFELDVVAAAVIGGVSIAGGMGSVPGAVLGALFLGVIKNALPVVNISPFWQLSISGTVIIVAVAFNARAERTKGRVILKRAEVAQ